MSPIDLPLFFLLICFDPLPFFSLASVLPALMMMMMCLSSDAVPHELVLFCREIGVPQPKDIQLLLGNLSWYLTNIDMGACEETIIALYRGKSINSKVDLIASDVLMCGVQFLIGLVAVDDAIASCRSAGS